MYIYVCSNVTKCNMTSVKTVSAIVELLHIMNIQYCLDLVTFTL